MILMDQLTIRAGTFTLEKISFQVAEGKYAVLMGKTGSGKTTILEAICGLRAVRQGRIVLGDRDVTRLAPADRGVGYVPQDLALFRSMTVAEHLQLPLLIRRWERTAIAQRVALLLEMLGIGHLTQRRPHGLSGGEAQRVALGRALAFQPRFLLLDEPLSALDEETRAEMCQLLRTVQRQTGVTLLHVTHNVPEARRLADQVLLLEARQVREVPLAEFLASGPGNGQIGAETANAAAEH